MPNDFNEGTPLILRPEGRTFQTRQLLFVLLLGQTLAIANTAASSFTTLLARHGTSIPAAQTILNYALLNCLFTPYTVYRYGFRPWTRLLIRDGWKYAILALCDVQGNFFIVLAYRHTTILSAQLINFWAIVVVVLVSAFFLGVRYRLVQIVGILTCIAGMIILLASDKITNNNGGNGGNGDSSDLLKGDLFALLGATFYGLTNTAEEYLVSTRPVYEVLGQMAFFATLINGVQALLFNGDARIVFDGQTSVYLTGYTLSLTLFYSLVPFLLRRSSAAFFNISLLTMNFWGVLIGIAIFHFHVHVLYPLAFLLILLGQVVYYIGHREENRLP
ncbi:hypothetical protein ASPZODRAFT_14404 [Penicilliopsis zonata CBS 506.65]|uniref:EamA domain-containing protein n=1 Tax=Penicilliopsis zonata CBS 506.65 TaxID=1073090 RepID=A0A1L9SM06_9EURO|nr:hypothetical protein ASPZODRAFT_14404 [Penicilliopsis zonata CBS 506.65]OJJ48255.1 hypothetical protein ASPZODRAFT_14404 [Penicilliopsis zonata CBS 506.65]